MYFLTVTIVVALMRIVSSHVQLSTYLIYWLLTQSKFLLYVCYVKYTQANAKKTKILVLYKKR